MDKKLTFDPLFAKILQEEGYVPDCDNITKEDVRNIENLHVDCCELKSLKGIEYFESLLELDCNGNDLITLDLSKNINLGFLYCSSNKLISIELSRHLHDFDCSDNNLESLDLSIAKPYNLYCSKNHLTELIIDYDDINILDCSKNKISHLRITEDSGINYLDCSWNILKELDITSLAHLDWLDCSNNLLESLDILARLHEDAPAKEFNNLNFSFNPGLNGKFIVKAPFDNYNVPVTNHYNQPVNYTIGSWDLKGHVNVEYCREIKDVEQNLTEAGISRKPQDMRVMTVKNINSSMDLANELWFVEGIMTFNLLSKNLRNDLWDVIHKVPCYLINDELFGELFTTGGVDDFGIEALGLYCHNPWGKLIDTLLGYTHKLHTDKNSNEAFAPAVYICPERIMSLAKGNYDDFLKYLAIVIIHEYYHAFSYDCLDKTEISLKNNAIWMWMEESSANAMTLIHIEKSMNPDDSSLLEFAANFMERQPSPYKLGLRYHTLGISEWCGWIVKGVECDNRKLEINDFINFVSRNIGTDHLKKHLWKKLDDLF